MKLIWHIIKKDIRRDRWALLFWVLLFMAQIGLGLLLLNDAGGDRQWLEKFKAMNTGLIFLQFVLSYFLTTSLVQADELTGTRMFWRTRPISSPRLLAAKALGAFLLFALLPVLLLLPWWIYCDFNATNIFWTAVEIIGWQLLVIAPAFLIASLTDDLARTLMWTLILVVVTISWVNVLQGDLHSSLGGPAGSHAGTLFTRLWLGALVLVTGAGLLAAYHFLTRRFFQSLIALVPLVGLIAWLGLLGPGARWDWTPLFSEINQPSPPWSTAYQDVQLELESAQLGIVYPTANLSHPQVLQLMKVRALPEELALLEWTQEQSWHWPDGTQLVQPDHGFVGSANYDGALRAMLSFAEVKEDPETARWLEQERQKRIAAVLARGLPFPAGELRYSLPKIPAEAGKPLYARQQPEALLVGRIQADQPGFAARLECRLYRPEIVFEIPLKSNVRGAGDSQGLYLLAVATEELQARVRAVEVTPSPLGNGLWRSTFMDWGRRFESSTRTLLAVNRVAGEFSRIGSDSPFSVQVGGAVISWKSLWIRPRTQVRDGKWVAVDPDWLAHTTIAFVPYRGVARFTREVKTDKFILLPSPSEQQPANGAGLD